jgi:hypothetical protein
MIWSQKAPRSMQIRRTGQTENELNKRIRSEGKTNTQQKSLPDVSTIGSIQFGLR